MAEILETALSAELEKQVALLRRKVARERDARKAAERQLEDYSRQIYLSNQALQRSLHKSQKRQRDLEFLAEASAGLSSSLELKELLHSTAEMTANFASAVCACYHINELPSFEGTNDSQMWFGEKGWRSEPLVYQKVLSLLPDTDAILDNWLIRESADVLSVFQIPSQWLVALNFKLPEEKIGWLIFLLDQELLDEEILYVLDTAKTHIRSGIMRQVDSRKLTQKNRELNRVVRNLETAQRQLVHSEKMASLGQLAAGVAHEINNPIGFILSNQRIMQDYVADLNGLHQKLNQLLVKDEVSSDEIRQVLDEYDIEFLLEDIAAVSKDNEEGAEKVSDIVNSLKSFSHSAEVEFRELDIYDCIQKSLKVVANVLKSQRDVKVNVPEQLPVVMGSASQIQQVLINLLVNAAQATGVYGSIVVSAMERGHCLDIAVTDDGCGMDEHTISRLFTPFFTTKEVGVGTGLGLSVSHGIVEAHGGEILVTSEPGKGSTFTVVLPCQNAALPAQ